MSAADDQPCDECAQMQRRLLAGSIIAGAVLGAGLVFVILKAAK